MDKTLKVLGFLEKVDFPEFGIDNIKAKIDTGAYTGAFHCTKIEEIESKAGKILQFSPFDHPETILKTDQYEIFWVRSSNGVEENRYFIKTTIRLQDEEYTIKLSLADRSGMDNQVLIGRRFLAKNGFLVDVRKGRQYLNDEEEEN